MKRSLAKMSIVVAVMAAVACSEKKKPAATASESKPTASDTRTANRPQLPDQAEAKAPAQPDPPGTKRAEHKSKQLLAYDKDGDGVFSPEERMAMVEQRLDRTFKELDTDSDGKLTSEELGNSDARMARRLERRFKKLDADDSGSLDREELQKLMTGPSIRPRFGGSRPRGLGGAQKTP